MRYDSGITTVTTSGTAVRVNNIQDRIKAIRIKSLITNTATVLVGRTDVEGSGTLNGFPISPGEDYVTNFGDGSVALDVFWIDATANSQSVAWEVIYEAGED